MCVSVHMHGYVCVWVCDNESLDRSSLAENAVRVCSVTSYNLLLSPPRHGRSLATPPRSSFSQK